MGQMKKHANRISLCSGYASRAYPEHMFIFFWIFLLFCHAPENLKKS